MATTIEPTGPFRNPNKLLMATMTPMKMIAVIIDIPQYWDTDI